MENGENLEVPVPTVCVTRAKLQSDVLRFRLMDNGNSKLRFNN